MWKRILLVAEAVRSHECAHGLETLCMQVFTVGTLEQDLIFQVENFQVLFKLLPEHEQLSEPRKKIPPRCVYKAISKAMNKIKMQLQIYLY